jgi:ABC-type amino acid transport substrate-binding protein
MNKRLLSIISMVLLLTFILTACQQANTVGQTQNPQTESKITSNVLDKIKSTGKLIVGIAPTNPGAYKDVNTSEWTGINIDVAKELAKFLNAELVIVETSWDLFLPGLNNGDFDIYMPGTFYTGARALQANFTDPAYYKGISAIVNADDNRFASIEDFNAKGVKVAVRLGAIEADLGPKFFPAAEFVEFKTNDAPTIGEAVKVGNADVWVADEVMQTQYLKENPWAKKVGDSFGRAPISYVIRYGDADWLAFMNNFVEYLRSSGQMKIFLERYGQNTSTLGY